MVSYRRLNKFVMLVGFVLLAISGFIVYRVATSRLGSGVSFGHQITIFSSPSVSDQIVEISRAYSSSSGAKIVINYATEAELPGALSEFDSSGGSVGFVGYDLVGSQEDSAVSLGLQKIIGVSNIDIDGAGKGSSSKYFKNLCQLEQVANIHNASLFLSSDSASLSDVIRDIYKKDCASLCLALQQKIVSLTDSSPLEFLIENKDDYILVGKQIFPRLLADNGFVYKEAMGLFFHFHESIPSRGGRESKSSAYEIIEIVNNNHLTIIAEDSAELEEVKAIVFENCQGKLFNPNFLSGQLDAKKFRGHKGVLIGSRRDLDGYGDIIYQTNRSGDIWFRCQNLDDEVCKDFQSFLSTRKVRSISKKYE